MRSARLPGRDDREAAVLLRHDLVAPITQILGYCELLIDDAEEKGRVYRSQSLRSIRALGKQVLAAIDRVLLGPADLGLPGDLAALVPTILIPIRAISEACNALEDASSVVPDRGDFLVDLARIREAASALTAMVRQASVTPASSPG